MARPEGATVVGDAAPFQLGAVPVLFEPSVSDQVELPMSGIFYLRGMALHSAAWYGGGMLWRLFQLSIVFAVGSANIYWKWTDNGYIVAAWGFMAAYTCTVFPFTVIDWWRTRHVRAEEYAYRKSVGLSYGWRRHLPWAVKRDALVAKQIRANNRIRRDRTTRNGFLS